MILILDTSIWIEYFKGKENYFDGCHQFIKRGEVFTTEIIFAELLQGAMNKREVDMIKSYFDLIPKINISQLYIQASDFSRNEKLHSKGIGLLNASIIKATILSKSNYGHWTRKLLVFLVVNFYLV